MTELGIGTIIALESWLLITSLGQSYATPFDEWLWYAISGPGSILFGILIFSILDRMELKKKLGEALGG
jgi:hypothetical protein